MEESRPVPIDERVHQALWDAYISALYLLNRYRHVHAGRPVRDLDEAEESLSRRKWALAEICEEKDTGTP